MTDAGDQRIDGVDVDGMSAYLARSPVVFAVLFGSHARGTADESSDVDVALGFPDGMTVHERFDARNRIDAELQEYAEHFVDVSDVESLPTPVAYASLQDAITLAGAEDVVEAYRRTSKPRTKRRRTNGSENGESSSTGSHGATRRW